MTTSTSELPLYWQIATNIRNQIHSRAWMPGDQIPPETSLAAAYGVSVMTARHALGLLVQEGLLARQRGRGTFVTDAADRHGGAEIRITASLDEIAESIAGLQVEPISIERARGPLAILHQLQIPEGEEMVRIARRRLLDGTAISYAVSYLPEWLGGSLTEKDLGARRLIDLLEQTAGVHFRDATQTIEATTADPESAQALGVTLGVPLLLVHREYRLDDGRTGYVAILRYPSSRFRYSFRLVRKGDGSNSWAVTGES